MISDEQYEICLPVLEDASLDDEEKTDKLEELLRENTQLTGASLDNIVLDALWRFRDGNNTTEASPPPLRHAILRRPSPAYPWRSSSGTPLSGSPRLGVSPLAPPGFVPTSFGRPKPGAAAASPFSSPRPSPRLALAQPVPTPSSPSLNAYEFAYDATPATEISAGEYPGESVDWLVGGDDAISLSSSVGTGSVLNAAAPEFSSSFSSTSALSAAAAAQALLPQAQNASPAPSQSQQQHPSDMTPYDMLRSILGTSKTDDEIETTLAMNNYDLSATIAAMGGPLGGDDDGPAIPEEPRSMAASRAFYNDTRPSTPVGGQKNVICKFYLSAGQCLRADCRFSHDLSNHLCKYWVMGTCLAGETCIFSHDPAQLVSKLAIEGTRTPPTRPANIHDYNSFPVLGRPGTPDHYNSNPTLSLTPPAGFKGLAGSDIARPRSRPGSRHNYLPQHHHHHHMLLSQQQQKDAAPSMDDPDAFPSLGAMPKQGKKHHGKRGGHNHGPKDGMAGHIHKDSAGSVASAASGGGSSGNGSGLGGQSLLADIVRMAPSPVASPASGRMVRQGSSNALRTNENSAAAMAIPSPRHVPWLEVGERANKGYLRARHEALRHYGQRNKFLQNAAQAWNRNDVRAAKALSLRGQSENELMRRAHREAARELYAGTGADEEVYIDLHGLHAEEAVAYLAQVLVERDRDSRPVYAITGAAFHHHGHQGHHKGPAGGGGGRDKVTKAIRTFLGEWRYAFREFAVPGGGGAGGAPGGILGIDSRSWDRSLAREGFDAGGNAVTAAPEVESVPAEGGGALLVTPEDEGAAQILDADKDKDKDVGGGVGLGGAAGAVDAGKAAAAVATVAAGGAPVVVPAIPRSVVVMPLGVPVREPPKGPSAARR